MNQESHQSIRCRTLSAGSACDILDLPAGASACSPSKLSLYIQEFDHKGDKSAKQKNRKKAVTTPRSKADKPSHHYKPSLHDSETVQESREKDCIVNATLTSDTQRTKVLNVSRNKLETFECPMYQSLLLPLQITTINLSCNCLTSIPSVLQHISTLRNLNMSDNKIEVIAVKHPLSSLQSLDLSSNPIENLPDADTLHKLPHLNELILRKTKICNITPDDIDCLSLLPLLQLDLSNNEISSLPTNLGNLSTLESLDISNNKLVSVPSSVSKLIKMKNFDIRDNDLCDPPQELAVKGGIDAIKRYVLLRGDAVWVSDSLVEQADPTGSRSSQYKLIVVGNERQGKTSVVHRLTHHTVSVRTSTGQQKGRLLAHRDENTWEIALDEEKTIITTDRASFEVVDDVKIELPEPESTIGIDLHNWRLGLMEYARGNEGSIAKFVEKKDKVTDFTNLMNLVKEVSLSVWDFAGQEIYHAGQEVFFSNHALYMVVWDMRKNAPRDFDTYVQFWIDLIQSRCPGSTILVVGTNADKFSNIADVDMICQSLAQHLDDAEARRVESIKHSKSQVQDISSNRAINLDKLLALRPRRKWIVPVSCKNGHNIAELTMRIVELSAPSIRRPHPFQLVNIRIPTYYNIVKEIVSSHVATGDIIMSINDLNAESQKRCGANYSLDDTHDAVTFLSCIGEVVWFGSLVMNEFSTLNGSPSNCSDSGTWRTVGEEQSLRKIVFLKPKWLLDALKSILTHKLSENISLIRCSQNISSLMNHDNGVVSWKFIEKHLLRTALSKIAGNVDILIEALRNLLEQFGIIVPIVLIEDEQDAEPSRSVSYSTELNAVEITKLELNRCTSLPAKLDNVHEFANQEDLYLIPTLLSPTTNRSIPHPPKEYVHLEYRYILDGFVPPGLIEHIMAKMYSNSHLTDKTIKHCHRNQFYQSHLTDNLGHIKILIRLDRDVLFGTNFVSAIRIIGIGTALASQIMLSHLNKYDKFVVRTLEKFPGLCNSDRWTICPLCVMAQRDFADCGLFNQHRIDDLNRKLLQHSENTDDTVQNSWRQFKLPCTKHGCEVGPQLLTTVPDQFIANLTLKEHSDNMLAFFMEEVIRLQSVSSTVLSSAVCKVMFGIVPQRDYDEAMAAVKSKGNSIRMPISILERCSGVVIYSNDDQDVYVLSCEHFVTPRCRAYPPNCPGCQIIFLIGDKEKILYIADMKMRGNSFEAPRRYPNYVSKDSDPNHSSNYWDICALKPVYSIDPVFIPLHQPHRDINVRKNATKEELIERFRPLHVCRRRPELDQMIRIMGYPLGDELQIYWKRIAAHDLNGMISIDISCEEGVSGAPVVDREGKVLGIFCSSTQQTSYVEPAAHFVSLLGNSIATSSETN